MNLKQARILAILFSALSFSAQLFAWTGAGEVKEIISHDGLHIINTTIADNPCSKPNLVSFYWPTSDPDAKDMFSLALSAFMSGNEISVHYSSANCHSGIGNAALITHLKIQK